MAILTGNPVAGIHTYFGLASTSGPLGVVDDVSDFLDSVESSSDADELDATTFRRPAKNIIAGFTTRSLTLGGKWSPESEEFFAPVEGLSEVKYEYGPAGNEVGMPLISGECTVLSYSGPQASVDGITTFSVELRLQTKTNSVFPVALDAGRAGNGGAAPGAPA
ncbi:MAG: hypothetical protein EHM88_17110, partial [Candidatus Rokuibacteriota bacterium]